MSHLYLYSRLMKYNNVAFFFICRSTNHSIFISLHFISFFVCRPMKYSNFLQLHCFLFCLLFVSQWHSAFILLIQFDLQVNEVQHFYSPCFAFLIVGQRGTALSFRCFVLYFVGQWRISFSFLLLCFVFVGQWGTALSFHYFALVESGIRYVPLQALIFGVVAPCEW